MEYFNHNIVNKSFFILQSPVKQKKRKKPVKVDNFDKLVNSYKQKIMSSKATSKWFDN